MCLPQELVDEILSYLSLDDERGERSLQNCSLVAKSWIGPSRRHLFETVAIQEPGLKSWLDSIPPANDGLLRHVRSLSLTLPPGAWPADFYPVHRIDVFQDYFPSFHQLRHLSLSFVHLPSDISQQVGLFSAFRHTLSRLSLDDCKITISALGTLINCFPYLNRLDLGRIIHEVDDEPASPVSRPLIEQLYVSEVHWDGMHFFDQMSEIGLGFEEVVFIERPFVRPELVERVADTVGVSVKCLKLLQPLLSCACITRQVGLVARFANSTTTSLQTIGDPAPQPRYSLIVENSRNWRSL